MVCLTRRFAWEPRALKGSIVAKAALAVPAPDTEQLDLWAEAIDQATFVVDAPPVERDKYTLIGVPHVITSVTYRESKDKNKPRGFASVEATIAPAPAIENAIRRGWIPGVTALDQLAFTPGSNVVYNDGSTGIRRQLTQMFHDAGMCDVGGDPAEKGARFDRSHTEWDSCNFEGTRHDAEFDVDVTYPLFDQSPNGGRLLIVVKHGLRVSEYGEDSVTFYLS